MSYYFEKREFAITTNILHDLSPLPHIHPHLELLYMKEGASITIVDGSRFLLEAGNFFLTFPNQIHYYHDLSRINGYIFIFAPEPFSDFKEIFNKKIPVSPIIKIEADNMEIEKLLNTIMIKNNSDALLDKITAKGYLTALLGELLSNITLTDTPADYDTVKKVLLFCSENYMDPISLDTVSEKLHLSKYYISHIFSNKLHIHFTEFVNTLRIKHACNLLEKGGNVTDIALSSGFTSVRTFNRIFKQQLNMTPREYITCKH